MNKYICTEEVYAIQYDGNNIKELQEFCDKYLNNSTVRKDEDGHFEDSLVLCTNGVLLHSLEKWDYIVENKIEWNYVLSASLFKEIYKEVEE